jgi:metal-responsive CopG/Arc/MetJ family transcriptional regulator
MKIRKSLSFDEEMWEVIDKLRGDVSRSLFINKLLREVLKLKGGKSKSK